MKIAEILKPQDVFINVPAHSKPKLLRFMADNANSSLSIAGDEIFKALQSRESLGSTGIGSGIAIPHAPVIGVDAPFMSFARLAKPIDFQAIDEELVDIICLILTPIGEQSRYLTLLSKIARQLRSGDVLRNIRHTPDRDVVYQVLCAQNECK